MWWKTTVPYLYLTATNNKEFTQFTGKSSLTLFVLCRKQWEKKLGWSTIFHELKSVVKAKIAQNNSQVSEKGITVNQGQDSINELIIWKVNPFVSLRKHSFLLALRRVPSGEEWGETNVFPGYPFVASVTCSRYQIVFKWSVNFWLQFLVNDEMENISMGEISI